MRLNLKILNVGMVEVDDALTYSSICQGTSKRARELLPFCSSSQNATCYYPFNNHSKVKASQ